MPQRKPIRTKNTDVPSTTVGSGAMSPTNGHVCPGAQPTTAGSAIVEEFACTIIEGWRKTVCEILGVAKMCSKASEALSPDELHQLYQRLPFDRTVFAKLSAIGRCPHLHKPEVIGVLPPNWTTLRLLADLTPVELDAAISKNVLTPKAKRQDVKSWIDENTDHGKVRRLRPSGSDSQSDDFGKLEAAWDASPRLKEQWQKASSDIRKQFVQEILGMPD
jgi:hypothetical protein